MALDIQLQEIANSAAGVYSLVIDRTQRAQVATTATLRFVPINVPYGPVNSLVYINRRDFAGLEKVYGSIKARDERKGNFSIRTCRHALEVGPIVVMNMRTFDDTKDKAGFIPCSTRIADTNGKLDKVPFTKLLNTSRLWFPEAKRLKSLAPDALLSFANTGSQNMSIYVRKADVKGYDITLKEYFVNRGLELPEYVNPMDLVKDTFLDVYVFRTDFSNDHLNMANENYGYLFTEDGLRSTYVKDGVTYDPLTLLAQLEDAQFVTRYQGSIIPGIKDANAAVMDICQLINAETPNVGLMAYFNEDLADSKYSDWEDLVPEDALIAKRPYAIDFIGHSRFELNEDGTVKIPTAEQDFATWLSHDPDSAKHAVAKVEFKEVEIVVAPAEYEVYEEDVLDGETVLHKKGETKIYEADVKDTDGTTILHKAGDPVVKTPAETKKVKAIVDANDNSYTPNDLNETIQTSAWVVPGKVKDGLLGTSKFYMVNKLNGIYVGDYMVGADSNICRVKGARSVGKVFGEDGVTEYDVIEIEVNDFVATADKLPATGTDTITLNDGTELKELFATSVYSYNNIIEPSANSFLKALQLESYKPRKEQFTDGTAARQKEILNVMNTPSIVEGLKALTEFKLRYIVDAFKTFIEPNVKNQYGYLNNQLGTRSINNMPFMEDFENSTDPYFKDSTTSPLNIEYIPKGGNQKLVSSNSFSLPTEYASTMFFFGPGMKNNSTGREIIVPFAGAVSNAFLNKYLVGGKYPYTAVAGDDGIVLVDGMTGVEYDITDTERKSLEPFGYNPIIYIENQGFEIYGNQTAQQRIKSDLSKIHISELVLYIQERMRAMLKGYVFKDNDYSHRLEIYTKANEIMQQIYDTGGVYYFENIINETNNDQDIIDNDMGVLDTIIVATKKGEKWVHRTFLERGGNIVGFSINGM